MRGFLTPTASARAIGAARVEVVAFLTPPAIAALKVDVRGYPIPWFVSYVDGEPEFRAVEAGRPMEAHKRGLCWICGRPLGGVKVFTVGPMCGVNRISSEPPSHLACARFAVVACPFLSRPMAKRRDVGDLPHARPPGVMIERNPGVSLIWVTRSYRLAREGRAALFKMGPPGSVSWWCEGRLATRAEVVESIRTGLPSLTEIAAEEGPEALAMLQRMVDRAKKLLPA